MGHYIPYHRAKNYGAHRCRRAVITFDGNDVGSEQEAIETVAPYMEECEGGWTASWSNRKNELTVYATDKEALTWVSMLSG